MIGSASTTRRKVSTVLDEMLFRRIKLEAARQGKQINEILAEALEEYLQDRGPSAVSTGVVDASFGALRAAPDRVRRILNEEDGLLDAR